MSKPAPKPHATLGTIAAALVEADREIDAVVAARHGVTAQTISDWRVRAVDDPELGKLLAAARRRVLGAWRDEASLTYIAIARAIRTKVDAGEEISFSLIAAAKTYGSANLQAAALLGNGDDGDDDGEKQ